MSKCFYWGNFLSGWCQRSACEKSELRDDMQHHMLVRTRKLRHFRLADSLNLARVSLQPVSKSEMSKFLSSDYYLNAAIDEVRARNYELEGRWSGFSTPVLCGKYHLPTWLWTQAGEWGDVAVVAINITFNAALLPPAYLDHVFMCVIVC